MLACPKGTPPWWPFGHVESNEGGFQKLGRLSRPSPHHLLTWCLWDLRGFDREVMSEVDEFGSDGFGCVMGRAKLDNPSATPDGPGHRGDAGGDGPV